MINKINFVIPLQSPGSSKNWNLVERYCCQTIGSILQQTNPNWRIFLVCNESPQCLPDDSRITVVNVDFPMPANAKARMNDKWSKVAEGFKSASRGGDAYGMIVDADDLLEMHFVEFVLFHQDLNGYIVKKGWVWDTGSRLIHKVDDFNLFCGTSSVLRISEDQYPNVINGYFEKNVPVLTFGHTIVEKEMEKLGKPLKKIPYRAIIYRASSGENDSGVKYFPSPSRMKLIKQLMKLRLMNSDIKNRFNLYNENL